VSVTIIATGFKSKDNTGFEAPVFKERKIVNLDEKVETVQEAKQTSIIDEIKENEPFVYTKTEKEENINSVEDVISPMHQADGPIKEVRPTNNPTQEATNIQEAETNLPIVEFTFNTLNDEVVKTPSNEVKSEQTLNANQDAVSREEQIKLAQERIRKLKDITLKMKSPEGLAALEKQTAFERKNIVLENKTPSTESNVSRYTLSEGDDKKIEIRPNNSFLHDNVD
jgi:cell division protein FtsZ